MDLRLDGKRALVTGSAPISVAVRDRISVRPPPIRTTSRMPMSRAGAMKPPNRRSPKATRGGGLAAASHELAHVRQT